MKNSTKYSAERRSTLVCNINKAISLVTLYRGSSASNMSRYYDVYAIMPDGQPLRLTGSIAEILHYTYDHKREAIRITGYGFSATSEIMDDLRRHLGAPVHQKAYHI